MKTKAICVLLIIFLGSFSLQAQTQNDNIRKETFLYAIKGNDSLYLDKYDLPSIDSVKPCVIFLFGGGFFAGERDHENYTSYFEQLAKNGYSVISIDYRLGLKRLATEKNIKASKLIEIFDSSIDMAVEDLYDATTYVVNNANSWKIDKNHIVASGSSAGAITVLHGEYYIVNKSKLTEKLPQDFNYVGIMSFAGAIFSRSGKLKWNNKPCPILFFHGNADSNVPYDKVKFWKLGFYGSKYITKQLEEKKSPYYFYRIEDAAHEIANTPMKQNMNEILTFLDKFVAQKQDLRIETGVKEINKPVKKKNFKLKDFIKANFGL